MTLVASFSVRDWPIVLGDIMISMPARGRESGGFNIPTHANVNACVAPSTGRLISGLVQKVTILTPRLAIAWAGSALCARAVFREILDRSESPEFLDVAAVLNEWQHEAGMDLYVTGLYLGDTREAGSTIVRFAWDSENGWETRKQIFPDYGNCYVGGTGADTFLNLLGNATCKLPPQTPPLESVICLSLAHLGKLAGDQIRKSAGINEFYGGAFEIASLLAGHLKKIGDVAYHFWEARLAQNAQVTITFHISLKIDYFEDYLIIRKLEYGNEIAANTVGADELYVIRPVYRSVDDTERARLKASVTPPSMNANFSVFYVHLPEIRGGNDAYIGVHKSSTIGESDMIRFEEGNDDLKFKIHPEVVRRIQQALNEKNQRD